VRLAAVARRVLHATQGGAGWQPRFQRAVSQLGQQFSGAIGGPVIYKDQFLVEIDRHDAAYDLFQGGKLVVNRYDQGNHGLTES
jgi:hypothetical protein